jgi:hypothetical protein
LLCSHSRPSPRRLGKRKNVQDTNNKGQVGLYLHPKRVFTSKTTMQQWHCIAIIHRGCH